MILPRTPRFPVSARFYAGSARTRLVAVILRPSGEKNTFCLRVYKWMRHIGSGDGKLCRAHWQDSSRRPYEIALQLSVAGAFSMADNLLFYTELVSMPVLDIKGRRIGRVKDAALVPVADAARIDRFLVGGGYTWLTVRADQIRSITLGRGIQLCDEQLLPYHDDEYMLRIGRDLLDQQIIDVTGRKVVRVTDVTMRIHHDGQRDILTVFEVDIGLRSIFRRLAQGLPPPSWIRRLQQPIPPNSIRWEFANVLEPDPLRRLRLNISYSKLEDMHPADLADIVEELSPAEREAISPSSRSISAFAASSGASPRACSRPPGSAACNSPFPPTPSAGNSPTCSNPTRSAACASTSLTASSKTCTRPTSPTSSRN